MSYNQVRHLVKDGLTRCGLPNNTSDIVKATLLRVPPSIVIPLGSVGIAVGATLSVCPFIKDVKVAKIPLVGELSETAIMKASELT